MKALIFFVLFFAAAALCFRLMARLDRFWERAEDAAAVREEARCFHIAVSDPGDIVCVLRAWDDLSGGDPQVRCCVQLGAARDLPRRVESGEADSALLPARTDPGALLQGRAVALRPQPFAVPGAGVTLLPACPEEQMRTLVWRRDEPAPLAEAFLRALGDSGRGGVV